MVIVIDASGNSRDLSLILRAQGSRGGEVMLTNLIGFNKFTHSLKRSLGVTLIHHYLQFLL